jgi:hypothetical protein
MPTNKPISTSASFPAQVTTPANGDAATSVCDLLTDDVADGLGYLKGKTDALGSGAVLFGKVSVLAGVTTISAGTGFTAAVNSPAIQITFSVARATAHYMAVATAFSAVTGTSYCVTVTRQQTGLVDFTVTDVDAAALKDAASDPLTIYFHVMGGA